MKNEYEAFRTLSVLKRGIKVRVDRDTKGTSKGPIEQSSEGAGTGSGRSCQPSDDVHAT